MLRLQRLKFHMARGGAAICAALKSPGVIFVAENGEVPGVRLRKS